MRSNSFGIDGKTNDRSINLSVQWQKNVGRHTNCLSLAIDKHEEEEEEEEKIDHIKIYRQHSEHTYMCETTRSRKRKKSFITYLYIEYRWIDRYGKRKKDRQSV
jgi:hypothetical protein